MENTNDNKMETAPELDAEGVAKLAPEVAPEATAETTSETAPVKQTKKQLFWEIFRFLLVGGTATICDYIVFWLLDGVLLPLVPLSSGVWETAALWIATALGFIVGMIVNWLLSISFVFKAVKNKEQSRSTKSFLIFVIISAIGLGLTLGGVWLITHFVPNFELFGVLEVLGTTWIKWVAKVIMTCIVLVWNYLGRKIFIFK